VLYTAYLRTTLKTAPLLSMNLSIIHRAQVKRATLSANLEYRFLFFCQNNYNFADHVRRCNSAEDCQLPGRESRQGASERGAGIADVVDP